MALTSKYRVMYFSIIVVLGKVKKGVLKIYKEYHWLYITKWAFKSSASLLLMLEAIYSINMIKFKKKVVIKGLY